MVIANKESLVASANALLEPYQKRIVELFDEDIVRFETDDVVRACSYAFKSGGKRLRPSIVLSIAQAVDPSSNADLAALAVECFQVATLIVDDLPCMDDDDTRRGKPATHIAFSETIAILASYALTAQGYGLIQENELPKQSDPVQVLRIAMSAASATMGSPGVIGGQYSDISLEKGASRERLRKLIDRKTASLFELCFLLGWLYGGGSLLLVEKIKLIGRTFGRAFQLIDDLDDFEEDVREEKASNYAACFGVEETQELIYLYAKTCVKTASEVGLDESAVIAFAQEMAQFGTQPKSIYRPFTDAYSAL